MPARLPRSRHWTADLGERTATVCRGDARPRSAGRPALGLMHDRTDPGIEFLRVTGARDETTSLHTVSVVIPVYQGESTLDAVVAELLDLPSPWVSDAGHRIAIAEILLIWDNGPDGS